MHSPPSITLPQEAEAEALPTQAVCDAADGAMDVSNFDIGLFWDPSAMAQNMLPATLFDINFPISDAPSNMQPLPTSSFSRFSSRLPTLDDIDTDAEEADNQIEGIDTADAVPWSITESGYERFCLKAQQFWEGLPTGCSLPSRNSLARYLQVYLMCVQKFLPMIHCPTFLAEEKNVELLLAMAALGCLYKYEYSQSYELYFIARAILLEKKRREDLQLTADCLSGQNHSLPNKENGLERTQTFILLINFASWADKKILPDALSMGSQLAALVRENGISKSDEMALDVDWLSWVAVEERRRTLLAAYVLFNLHSIAYNTPPLIFNHEVGVCLPGSLAQWEAKNAIQWQQSTRHVERLFREGIRCCFDGTGFTEDASVSSFSNYLLIHGLFQQIYIDRHGFLGCLTPNSLEYLEAALRTWQKSWELTNESTLDPLSPKGPFGLSATAILRLAYIYLNSDLGPCGGILSRDLRFRTALTSSLKRSRRVDRAIFHAVHALSIPVRLGIDFVARTKTPIWTIEHSLCSLECALLLKDWIEMISVTVQVSGLESLRTVEKKLLEIIRGIIKETSFAETLNIPNDDASHVRSIAAIVVKLWAQIFQGVHIYDIDNQISSNLQLLQQIPTILD